MAPPLPTPSPRPGAPPMTPQAGASSTPFRTPTSKHRLHFPSATPRGAAGAATEHPVEVIGNSLDARRSSPQVLLGSEDEDRAERDLGIME
ncbi:hypothetical protein QYE76_048768 [Lolium multiflorum]|uniref:Uncharacterized protein n=1 Tax=Lolium multiflorum TaxID=4521 RepID=A0AAD8WFP6_LOLMU|nr:hypothetical protein QYE76_048768 [Lolium multiflorum]